jgi:hypothetical protein
MVTTRIPYTPVPSVACASLRRWLALKGIDRRGFAIRAGCTRAWAYLLVDGEKIPNQELGEVIFGLTDGAVVVSDWRVDYAGDINKIEVPAAPVGRPRTRTAGSGETGGLSRARDAQRATARAAQSASRRRRTRSTSPTPPSGTSSPRSTTSTKRTARAPRSTSPSRSTT